MTKILPFLIVLTFSYACSTIQKENIRSMSSLNSSNSCITLVQEILRERLSSVEKARLINDQEGLIKGSFAEIGAGQEIAGTFFKAERHLKQ